MIKYIVRYIVRYIVAIIVFFTMLFGLLFVLGGIVWGPAVILVYYISSIMTGEEIDEDWIMGFMPVIVPYSMAMSIIKTGKLHEQ
jgi:hypothetical protein